MRGILQFVSRTILLHIVAAVVIGLIASYAVIFAPDSPKLQSEEGILDLTQVHVSENPLKLQGEWAFYWQELLSPEDIQIRSARDGNHDRWISIPSSWLGYRLDGQQLNGTGFATFRVVIELRRAG
ncbi:hypothetical protein SAMN03159341_1503 [Paenibacillus sp. 1_12]|uniref:hypothetical protein n=1 Tax=Paenibacillus sp. 1_12 TaxID=1566278 RepID=UPI0008E9D3A9|nr:hypothetical protein [Paenibacillus sp. 1_12]SFM55393.1 hypothetical protein SAMN03159341_1503 [Paenibacillus sp. 1_12]